MGIIQRQSIKHTIFQYIGIAVGAISMLYVYPNVLEAYGLTQSLFAAASFLAPAVSFGTWVLAVKFFPDFKNEEKNHNGFLGLLLLIAGLGFLIFLLCFPMLQNYLSKFFLGEGKSEWYIDFLPYVVPFTFFIVFNRLLGIYASNFHRIVIPSILEEFLLKIALPSLLLLYFYEYIPIHWVIYGILINYFIGTIGLVLYLLSLGQKNFKPRLNFISKKLRKEMASYAGYGVVNALGTQSAFRIDTLMVARFTNFETTGVFGQANFMAEAMSKPQKSIVGIAGPLISKAINENNLKEVKSIYKKSSINLLIVGLFLFIGLWSCLDDLFDIMGNPVMQSAKYAILFLCFARLINMGTSVNNEIINYSKYYRFNFIMIIILAVLNITLNIWLIKAYGITGAGIATLISFAIFNFSKLIFIKLKFGFHPFTKGTIILMVIAFLSFGASTLLPDLGNPYLNILLKGGVITAIFPTMVYFSKISEDYNRLIEKELKSII